MAALVGGLLLAAGGLWLVRIPLAEWLITRATMALGYGPATLTVARFNFTSAEVLDLQFTLGAIDRIALEYDLATLLKGKIAQIEIYGADLRLAWGDSGLAGPREGNWPTPPKQDPAAAPTDRFRSIALPVQAIYVRRSTVHVGTNSHSIKVTLDGSLTTQAAPSADFRFSVASAFGRVTGWAGATLDPDGNISGTAKLADGSFEVGAFRVSDLSGNAAFSGTTRRLDDVAGSVALRYSSPGQGEFEPYQIKFHVAPNSGAGNFQVTAPAANISFRADAVDRDGRINYSLDGELQTETLEAFLKAGTVLSGVVRFGFSGRTPQIPSPRALADLSSAQWLAEGQLNGTVELTLDRMALPTIGEFQGFKGTALLRADQNGLVLNIPGGLSVTALTFAPELIERDTSLGHAVARAGAIDLALYGHTDDPFLRLVPQQGTYLAKLAAGFSVAALETSVRGSAKATLEPDKTLPSAAIGKGAVSRPAGIQTDRLGRFTVNSSASLQVGDMFAAEAISAELSGRYTLSAVALEIDKVEGHFEARELELGGRFAMPGATRAVFDPGRTELKFDRTTDALTGSITLKPLSLSGTFKPDAGESQHVRAAAESLSFTATSKEQRAILEDGRVELPAYGVSATGISANASLRAETVTLDIGVAELQHMADPPLFVPLELDIDVRADGERVKFSAFVHDPSGLLSARLSGQHELLTGDGKAHVRLDPLKLGPGRDVVSKLFPMAATEITSAQGTISLIGDLNWNSEARTANINLGFDDIAFSTDSLGLSALNGKIHLDGFAPPTTPPTQHVAAIADIPQFGRVPLDLTFQLEPGRLVVEQGTAELLGGWIKIHDTAFEAAPHAGQFDLRITDVDLAAISKLIDLEEIEGTGRLSGVLPIQFNSGRVAIVNGRLTASGPGTVRLATTALTKQFEGRGDTIDLTLRALSDFHYERLTLDIKKPFEGNGAVLAHLEGANPALLEGHPFVFNISLTADFERLTRLIATATEMGGQALDWGARRARP